jgi:YggT family protein
VHEAAQLVRLVVQIEVILIFVRILLSWFPGIPPWHPLVRALAAVTDPILVPFRRVIPPIGMIDISPIVALVVLQLVGGFAADLLDTGGAGEPVAFVIANAFRNVIHAILLIFIIIVVLRLVVSLMKVNPFHPAVRLIRDISTPLVRPFAAVATRNPTADVPAIVALVVYVGLIVLADWLLGDLVQSTAPAVYL